MSTTAQLDTDINDPADKWAAEKAAFTQGRKIERKEGNQDWHPCISPQRFAECEYRIAPDPTPAGKSEFQEMEERIKDLEQIVSDQAHAKAIADGRISKLCQLIEGALRTSGDDWPFESWLIEAQKAIANQGMPDSTINTARSPTPACKMSDKELGEIGAKAAMKHIPTHVFGMAITDKSAGWGADEPARTAFAAAVRKQVEKEQADEIARLTKGVEDAASTSGKALLILGILGFDALNNTPEQLIEQASQKQAKFAAAEKRLAELEWRPVSVKPTREDADMNGNVIATNGTQFAKFNFTDFCRMSGHWTHWTGFSPPPHRHP